MSEFIKTNYIIGLDLPDWLVDQFYYEFGFIIKNKSIKHLEQTSLPILVFEQQLIDLYKNKTEWQRFKDSVIALDLRHIVLYSRDMYSWPTDLFEQLNSMAEQKNFHIISNCDAPTDYKNLSIHIHNEVEYGINDPVFESLAFELQRNRKSPSKDFLLASVLKNEFRRAVYDYLLENKLLDNSVSLVNGKTIDGETIEVTPQHSDLLDDILKATKDKHFINGLNNFEYGKIGLPVFTAYEQCFCEIVLETSHQGISDISEKTYRPILFGIPIVFLGSEKMYNKLLADGYVIPGKTFYSTWYSTESMQDRLDALKLFCRDIINDDNLRGRLSASAQHNFEVFWTKRHSRNRKQNLEIIHKCFGDDNLITQIYKSLNS
jgi:hypothetical protein